MSHVLMVASVGIGHLLTWLAEERVYKRNLPFLRHSGSEDLDARPYKAFYFWFRLAFPLFVLEYYLGGFKSQAWQIWGALLVLGALVLRVWSVQSLGRMWTPFGTYIYGVPAVNKGPYRLVRHPEYFSRILEVLGMMLIFSSAYSGALVLVFMCFYLIKICPAEVRQINMLAPGNLDPRHKSPAIPKAEPLQRQFR